MDRRLRRAGNRQREAAPFEIKGEKRYLIVPGQGPEMRHELLGVAPNPGTLNHRRLDVDADLHDFDSVQARVPVCHAPVFSAGDLRGP